MTLLEMLDVAVAHRATPARARNGFNEQATAESYAAMNLTGGNLDAVLPQGLLPGDRVWIDGIDQSAVEVEDQCFHTALDTNDGARAVSRGVGRVRASDDAPRAQID